MGDQHLGDRSLDRRAARLVLRFERIGWNAAPWLIGLVPAYLFQTRWRDWLTLATRDAGSSYADAVLGLVVFLVYALGLVAGVAFTLHRVRAARGEPPHDERHPEVQDSP